MHVHYESPTSAKIAIVMDVSSLPSFNDGQHDQITDSHGPTALKVVNAFASNIPI